MNETTNLTANSIVGVIGGEQAASQAAAELRQAGYSEPTLLTGEAGAQQIDAKNENGSVLGRLIGAVQNRLSESTNYLRQYEEEARAGNYIIAVDASGHDAAARAQAILEKYGARNIRHFGTFAVSDLTPDSNPSLRSADSPEPQRET